jgi:phage replication-related protein YjqB (UPF0714/DUF867 family)
MRTLCSALLLVAATCAHADTYENFAELAAHNREGRDYSIQVVDRPSPFVVYSIHGGNIERGTSELADDIAGTDLSRYDFKGLRPGKGSLRLHVTSHHYDEPRALALAAKSTTCISVHGYNPRPGDAGATHNVCIGGLNTALRARVEAELAALGAAHGFTTVNPCVRYEGSDPANIVNRCADTGVQLELSWQLHHQMLADRALRQAFADAIRRAAGAGQPAAACSDPLVSEFVGTLTEP